jgi:AraC-like DNA-binding protein
MEVSAQPPVQRLGPLAQLPVLLQQFGVPLAKVLEGLPVTGAELRPDAFLPIPLISAILERAADLTGKPVGLLLGKSQGHSVLGPLGKLMSCCDTLGEALGTFTGLQIANSTAAAAYLHRMGEDYAFGFGLYGPELGSSQIYDVSAAIGCNIVRDLTGGAVAPAELLLSRAVPPDAAPYREIARCPVRFNQNQTCLILPSRSMEFPLRTADRKARGELLGLLQCKLSSGEIGTSMRVRHALRPLIIAGRASLPEVAAHLDIHPRTLERRLRREGAHFETLKDEVRFAVSRELLALTELPASDIAATLGYATPSAFVRAFRRWTGMPPTQWRRGHRGAATG